MVLTKEKPVVKINDPQSDQAINVKKVEGTAGGNIDSITSVFIRLNDGFWKKANGTLSWEVDSTPFETGKNNIEAISIDANNDTSLIDMVEDVQYKEKMPPTVSFIYPNPTANVVQKCMRAREFSYRFKISMDSVLDIKKMMIIIEDSDKHEIRKIHLSQLPGDAIFSMPSNEYCFFVNYSITGAPNKCSINLTDDYYYRLEYTGTDTGKVIIPERIKVHFGSFDSENIDDYGPCNCE